MTTTFKDEFEIARIRVGVTTEKELNGHVQPLNYKGPAGYQVRLDDGTTLHYYTTARRRATLCVGCRKGIAQHVRLKLGFWGPLTELAEVPLEAVSDCSLECMGTYHGVSVGALKPDGMDLFRGKERVLKVYGPPTRESKSALEFDWLYATSPRRMTFGLLKKGGIEEMFLELLDPSQSLGMRPLGPAVPFERLSPLPEPLKSQMREGELHLREGRPADAERLFACVFDALTRHDPDPHNVSIEVAARVAVARASGGKDVPGAIARVEGMLKHLETYASYNPPDNLRTRFTLGQLLRASGNRGRAVHELEHLWKLLQASDYYSEPEVQDLVRRTAAELALAGEPRYQEEVNRCSPGSGAPPASG